MGNKPKNLSSEVAQSLRPAQRTNSITRCFIAMRKNGLNFSARRASGVILPMIAAAFLLFAGTPAGAQPSLPSGCTWSCFTQTGVTVPGTSCTITVHYCTACCSNGTAYSYVSEVDPTGSGPSCDAVDPENMIYAGEKYAEDQAVLHCAPPPCTPPQPGLNIVSYTPTCWTEAAFSGEYEITPCSDAGCYCQQTCQVCNNGSGLTYSNCTTITIGMCSCTTQPNQAPWVQGTCYTISCHTLQ